MAGGRPVSPGGSTRLSTCRAASFRPRLATEVTAVSAKSTSRLSRAGAATGTSRSRPVTGRRGLCRAYGRGRGVCTASPLAGTGTFPTRTTARRPVASGVCRPTASFWGGGRLQTPAVPETRSVSDAARTPPPVVSAPATRRRGRGGRSTRAGLSLFGGTASDARPGACGTGSISASRSRTLSQNKHTSRIGYGR